MTLASELSLPAILQRLVDLAVELTRARYGALGVLGRDGTLVDFITTGVTEDQRRAIGHLPMGRGVLGVLVRDVRPLRLADLTQDPRSVGFPPNHPPMRSFLGAPVVARGRVYGNLYLTEKQGAGEFSVEDEQALMVLAAQAGVAIDNARLYEEAQRRSRRLEALRELVTAILGDGKLDRALGLAARRTRELVEGDLTTIALPGERPEALALQVADGHGADRLRGLEVPIQRSVSGEVLRIGKTVVVADAAGDERVFRPVVEFGELGPAMFVPLRSEGQTFGTLMVGRRRGRAGFADADVELMETFADQAAVAFQYATAQRQLQRLAVLEDRERIARELHDGAIQALFAAGMSLQGTAMLAGDPEIDRRLQEVVGELDRVIRDLRNYIFGLRPGILADRQLDAALRQLADELEQRFGVTVVVEVDAQVASELASQAADVVQLAREALSNVSRHAHAVTCRVSLRREDDHAVLEVDDDGRGFDPERVERGHGLGNLSARVSRLGGDLRIHSSSAEGTTVSVSIPL
ncbi:MAG TPA: GAF domain-containing sensor histidine kinase [Actinomycetes bacterium]|nr:GAF domain-containing sensor histidine kinase [Actinomycetes bacterium]